VVAAAVALAVLTAVTAVGRGGEPWIATVYAAVVAFGIGSAGALAVQAVIGVVLVAALLVAPEVTPWSLAPLVAAVVATSELLAVASRLDSPIARDASDLLVRAGGAAVLAAAIFVAVATVARLPGPLGLTATALASTAVLIAALALLRGGSAGAR
jgi:hypothetical protein